MKLRFLLIAWLSLVVFGAVQEPGQTDEKQRKTGIDLFGDPLPKGAVARLGRCVFGKVTFRLFPRTEKVTPRRMAE
jgi:hypothetical protein